MARKKLREKSAEKEREVRDSFTRRRVMGTEQEFGIWPHEFRWENNGFTENGARAYYDCGHPEYASPECSNPVDAVVYSKAGEDVIKKKVGAEHKLFKNVTDGNGAFYGAHESYSFRGSLDALARVMIPFLTTRMIFAGAGGIHKNQNTWEWNFSMSQKAPSISGVSFRDTTTDKAIFNTKCEPLDGKNQRLHVICGDGNMNEVAEYLKLGTTALVLDLYEDGKSPEVHINEPVESLHRISASPGTKVRTSQGNMTAIGVQRVYLESASRNYAGRDDMTDDILARWKFVLDSMEQDPMSMSRWVDWVAKKQLIDSYMKKTGKKLEDGDVRDIDLRYHETGKEGLFYMLQDRGLVDRIVSDEQIRHAVENPPEDTRAWIRGYAVKYGKDVNWNYIAVGNGRIMDSGCMACSNSCKRYNDRGGTSLDDPLHNYTELEKEVKDGK